MRGVHAGDDVNRRTIQLAVLTLGAALVLIICGSITLAVLDKPQPDFLVTAGGACVGALALAIPRGSAENPPPASPAKDLPTETGLVPPDGAAKYEPS